MRTRNLKKNRRGEKLILGAALSAASLVAPGILRADVTVTKDWLPSVGGGGETYYDGFISFSDTQVSTTSFSGDAALKVGLPQQYWGQILGQSYVNSAISTPNFNANPELSFDLNLQDYTWTTLTLYVQLYNEEDPGATNQQINGTANNPPTGLAVPLSGFVGGSGFQHVNVDLSSILPRDPNAAFTSLQMYFQPQNGNGGAYTAQTIYLDNFSLGAALPPAVYSSASWKTPGSGSWSDSNNWNPVTPTGIPNGKDQVATFGTNGGTVNVPTTVTVGAFTVGTITFDNTNSYTLNGGAITIDTANTTSGHPLANAINVLSGSHTINSQVVMGTTSGSTDANPMDFNVVQASSTLTIPNFSGQFYTFQKDGDGMLKINKADQVSLFVNGGTVQFLSNGTTANISHTFFVQIANSAAVDLTNNGFVYQYGGATGVQDTVRGMLQNGYANGSWTGTGGFTSSSAAGVSGIHKMAIGYVDTADPDVQNNIPLSSISYFGTIDGTSILMRYTYAGDTNIDGTVGIDDFNQLAANFGKTGADWFQGDSNYDGVINLLDLNAIATNFGQTLPSSGAALGALVPEPMSMAGLGFAALLLKRRARKHQG
ncbi:MAG TPA: hypothetical protein VHS31_15730 [Tepidisphaeraceae bacterium]|jgi:hypothetical protein|nr:hypothetical protein [Tepidisphaeraceae bacterium]